MEEHGAEFGRTTLNEPAGVEPGAPGHERNLRDEADRRGALVTPTSEQLSRLRAILNPPDQGRPTAKKLSPRTQTPWWLACVTCTEGLAASVLQAPPAVQTLWGRL